MKKLSSFLLLFVSAFSLHVSAGKSGPWKLTGLDFYYSGHLTRAASVYKPYIYRYADERYAADQPVKTGFNHSRLRIDSYNQFYYRNGFSADLVFANHFSGGFSQEIRTGLCYSYVSDHVNQYSGIKYDYGSSLINARADTTWYYYASYKYAEKAVSLNLTYLLNVRLSNTVAVYGGGHLLVSPVQYLRIYYAYQDVVTKSIKSDSTIVLRSTAGNTINHTYAKSSFSAGYIIGLKFNLDCYWNIFFEYRWLYRRMGFEDKTIITDTGKSFQAGFRYKFGRVPDDDDGRKEKEKNLFW